ncbi:MAG TPA: vitamin K epoxide reductase family protein [Acidimicrobiales bacterium]|nr:vitamin K epoxide reductase family protein [Acidimicrobiales bacterium]
MAPKSPVGETERATTVAASGGSHAPEIDAELVEDDDVGRWVPPGVGGRVRITALVLSLLGLADSTYLTISHFQENILKQTCSTTGAINCLKVTTSPQSEILHIPVAILGLAFYVAMTVINLPPMWKTTDVRVAWLRLAMVVSGIGFVLYLIYAELFLIKAICEYCTGVHIVTFALFVLVVVTLPSMTQRSVWSDDGDGDEEPELSTS